MKRNDLPPLLENRGVPVAGIQHDVAVDGRARLADIGRRSILAGSCELRVQRNLQLFTSGTERGDRTVAGGPLRRNARSSPSAIRGRNRRGWIRLGRAMRGRSGQQRHSLHLLRDLFQDHGRDRGFGQGWRDPLRSSAFSSTGARSCVCWRSSSPYVNLLVASASGRGRRHRPSAVNFFVMRGGRSSLEPGSCSVAERARSMRPPRRPRMRDSSPWGPATRCSSSAGSSRMVTAGGSRRPNRAIRPTATVSTSSSTSRARDPRTRRERPGDR